MPTPAYPLSLRTVLQASKSRTQPASFRMSEPRRGYAYAQAIGTDAPVFWDVEFKFTRAEAIRFQIWFKTVISSGLLEFTLPIRTEFGLIEHTCRFLPEGLLDCREDGQSFSYSAKIMARAQVIPAAYLDPDTTALILALDNWDGWAEVLDIALTETLQ